MPGTGLSPRCPFEPVTACRPQGRQDRSARVVHRDQAYVATAFRLRCSPLRSPRTGGSHASPTASTGSSRAGDPHASPQRAHRVDLQVSPFPGPSRMRTSTHTLRLSGAGSGCSLPRDPTSSLDSRCDVATIFTSRSSSGRSRKPCEQLGKQAQSLATPYATGSPPISSRTAMTFAASRRCSGTAIWRPP